MYVIIGLGNPGREYEKTRHNVGFMAIDALCARLGLVLNRRGFRSVYGEGRIGSERIVLAKPETFMNNSGFAAVELMNWFKPEHDRLIVIYDDIDLPAGAMRIRPNGSAGTHNGMRSLISQLGFDDFPRIRIGIGKPAHGLIDHVLSAPSDDEQKLISAALPNAAEAVELIVRGHISEAQTKFNYKPQKKQNDAGGAARGANPRTGRGFGDYRPALYTKADVAELSNAIAEQRELFFINSTGASGSSCDACTLDDVYEAEARLRWFAPLVSELFPETKRSGGIIESPLIAAGRFQAAVLRGIGFDAAQSKKGSLYLKADSELPIAGSVKARGGIYEVLKHAEALARESGLIASDSSSLELLGLREFFGSHTIQVGSTGNLGLSIGLCSSALGFRTIVHMSADAKQWKKALLRENGVSVIEYASDYSSAVEKGREASASDPASYFIDDENSIALFMGYAVAALRLKEQLIAGCILVDDAHPLFVYIPCGVGGAPGGISAALKLLFGNAVHCFFVEPTAAPCMLGAFVRSECVHISEFGLDGRTDADGLAVGRASRLVFNAVKPVLNGEFTVSDARLAPLVRLLYNTEKLFAEPSAAASAAGYLGLVGTGLESYARAVRLSDEALSAASHILWITGGGLVPDEERKKYFG